MFHVSCSDWSPTYCCSYWNAILVKFLLNGGIFDSMHGFTYVSEELRTFTVFVYLLSGYLYKELALTMYTVLLVY